MSKLNKCIFFCYGTLQKGFWNHEVLGNAKYLGKFQTEPKYTLYDGGFPIVERDGKTSIQGELYLSENAEDIDNVFSLESCSSQIQGDINNWYDFDTIDTPHGKAIIFVMDKGKVNRTKTINNGKWK